MQAPNRENGRVGSGHNWQKRGGIVKRNYLILGIATLAVAGAMLAQDPPAAPAAAKKAASHSGAAGSPAKGKEIFDKKCALCHFADKDTKKIGPGLKGIGKRGTFTVNGNKVTTESLTNWIENGDSLMPPFKDVLEAPEIKDVVAYVKTL
jgi:mono/diheme cytochrome c family protein